MLASVGFWLNPFGFTPHGFCLLWEPWLIWAHGVADFAIGTSYFFIPIALIKVAGRRRDLVFKPMFWMFSGFILLCGAGHWLDLLMLWVPAYEIQAIVKLATALVSMATAIMLFLLLPRVIALPSPAQMRAANDALLSSYGALEATVAKRTVELVEANASLRAEAEQRERVEDQLRQSNKMEAVGQLTGGLAHDFNNLLTIINGNLDLMRLRAFQGRVADCEHYIDAALASTSRAGALTRRLLAFSRHQTLDPDVTDVNQLLNGMDDLFRRTVDASIRLETKLAKGLWRPLCDSNQLENALLNLVINARDAMPNGGHLIIETTNVLLPDQKESKRVSALESILPGEYVALAVTDTGTGMSAEAAAHAFEPFFTTKPLGEGTGLGLSMIAGFAHQYGGRVNLRSKKGHGTTVTIYLPRHFEAVLETTPPAAVVFTPSAVIAAI